MLLIVISITSGKLCEFVLLRPGAICVKCYLCPRQGVVEPRSWLWVAYPTSMCDNSELYQRKGMLIGDILYVPYPSGLIGPGGTVVIPDEVSNLTVNTASRGNIREPPLRSSRH